MAGTRRGAVAGGVSKWGALRNLRIEHPSFGPGEHGRQRGYVDAIDATQRGVKYFHRLHRQGPQRPVTVGPGAEVDLGYAIHTGEASDIDQESGFDSVSLRERHLFEDGSAARVLATERLVNRREFWKQRGEYRPGHQFGRSPTSDSSVFGPLVEPLDERGPVRLVQAVP
ncbi:MAG: hypothetical protein ACO20T_09830, partial [Ilumatobacteraceae bacterium]